MLDYIFDAASRRLHLRYTGFWTIDDARQAQGIFREALQRGAGSGPSFTLLDDLSQWPAQTQEVAALNRQFVTLCRGMPISRNAMIIPGAILKLQVHRTLDNMENCRVFPTFEQADEWLREVEPN